MTENSLDSWKGDGGEEVDGGREERGTIDTIRSESILERRSRGRQTAESPRACLWLGGPRNTMFRRSLKV